MEGRLFWNTNISEIEYQEHLNLSIIMTSLPLTREEDDWIWDCKSEKYSTTGCYRSLLSCKPFQKPWQVIWKLKIPPKVKLFL